MKMLFVFLTTLVMYLAPMGASAAQMGGQTEVQEYTYDFALDGGAVGFINLTRGKKMPVGSIVESGYYMVQTAMTSSGSATVAIGDADTGNRYKAAAAMDHADYSANVPADLASGVPLYLDSVNDGTFGITVGTAALTAGKIKFVLKVYKPKVNP